VPFHQGLQVFDPSPPTKTEPVFNVPWPVLGLCGFILGLYALQIRAPSQNIMFSSFGLNPIAVMHGDWIGLIAYICLHGSWLHAGMNAAWALVFATPVARAFGSGLRGIVSFIAFYIICGIVGGLGFVLLRWGQDIQAIGASGAVAGLMGAAMRLRYKGILLPLTDKTVVGFSVVWLVLNLASEFISLTPGQPAGGVAWQTHLFGYACGLLLIKPWVQLFHNRVITQI
jgi:membrane associated rhomboid family serine protease